MKVAVLGLGWISQEAYLPFLGESSHVEAILGYDADAGVRASLAGKFAKLEVAEEPDALFAGDVDLVVIATPSHLHHEQVLRAAARGRNVLCEKPVCLTAAQAQAISAAFAGDGPLLITSVPSRHRDEMQFLKGLFDDGRFGDVYHVRLSWMKRSGIPGGRWFIDKSRSGGGVLIDMGPHAIDLLRWLTGTDDEPRALLAAGSAKFISDPAAYAVWHRGHSGAAGGDVEDDVRCLVGHERLSYAIDLAWASQITADEVVISGFGTKGSFTLLTALGFSTNVKHAVARLTVTANGVDETRDFPLPERKAPFRRMVEDSVNRLAEGRIAWNESRRACSVSETIARLYDSMVVAG